MTQNSHPLSTGCFLSEGIEILHTSYRAPRANAFAEHWVRSVREDCLDPILVVDEKHLGNMLREYTNYDNHTRPHQDINQHFPVTSHEWNSEGPIRRRDILGGILTIIPGSLKGRSRAVVSIFTPYKVL